MVDKLGDFTHSVAEFILECPLFVLFYKKKKLSSFVLILFIKQKSSNFSKFKTQICKTGQNLFSRLWKSVQWLTANFLLDQHHQRNKTEWFGALYQNIMLQTNAISNIEHRNSCSPYLSATLWLSASIQLVAVEEMYHIILATQLQ